MTEKLKVSYINDLHLDNWIHFNHNEHKYKKNVAEFVNKLCEEAPTVKDLLIVSGDISHFNRVTYWVLDQFSLHYNKVIFVGGNHDYYLISKSQNRKYKGKSVNRAIELANMFKDHPKVEVLGSSSDKFFTEYKGFKIGGLTMTSKQITEEGISFYRGFMNDKRYIPESTDFLNYIDMNYYNELKSKNLDIFVSHYPLVTTYTHRMYSTDGSIESYKCVVDDLIAEHNFFGHVHESNQVYCIAETKHYTNAYGYPHEPLERSIQEVEIIK